MGKFAFIKLFVRVGPYLALLLALGLPAIGWCMTLLFDLHWVVGVLAVFLGILAGFLVMVLVDLTRVLMEMLMPQ